LPRARDLRRALGRDDAQHAARELHARLGLDPVDAKIVWLRAGGERWKTICWKVGLARAAANEHWLYALCVIAWRLNGHRVPGKRSRRHVIGLVREADIRVS
jgi:hypothetical protein